MAGNRNSGMCSLLCSDVCAFYLPPRSYNDDDDDVYVCVCVCVCVCCVHLYICLILQILMKCAA